MPAPRIKLNDAGIVAALSQSSVLAAIEAKARAVAEQVQAQLPDDVPVEHRSAVIGDRASGQVTIMHASGKNRENKHGYLVKAASDNGLTVRPWKRRG